MGEDIQDEAQERKKKKKTEQEEEQTTKRDNLKLLSILMKF